VRAGRGFAHSFEVREGRCVKAGGFEPSIGSGGGRRGRGGRGTRSVDVEWKGDREGRGIYTSVLR